LDDTSGRAVDFEPVVRNAMDRIDDERPGGDVADSVELRGLEVLKDPTGAGEQSMESFPRFLF